MAHGESLVESPPLWYRILMSLFCFLWMPLFYLFWRSISKPETEGSGGIWALLLGSIVALIRFFLGESLLDSFISPGAFGLSRWFSACIDIVTLPAVFPLLVCRVGRIPAPHYTHFALLWLIPVAAIRGVSWSAQNDPALLVLTPILWTALAVGLPFFIAMASRLSTWTRIPLVMVMAALPFLGATAYWAFFSQRTRLGVLLLAITLIPMGISVTVSFYRSCANS
ncbi:hypothetical protein AGMMS49942_13980 [Spirochaetia bacterium]|nr:hypothetical protein AGMMS49942_13980 [Spirochaetia bacterium]